MTDQISKKYKDKLFSYQIGNVNNIIRILKENNSVLDASDTGTGKTYTAIAACAELKLRPIIICPRSVMFTWKSVSKIFNVEPFFIVNYETLKFGKYYNKKGNRVKCPFLIYNKNEEDIFKTYSWTSLPKKEKLIFIFDEVHKCTNFDTFNGQLLLSAKNTDLPIMILSATLADKPEKIKMFAYVLNFIDKQNAEKLKLTFDQYMKVIDRWLDRDSTPMVRIHDTLYPDRGTRMRIDALGKAFPENQVIPLPYNIKKQDEKEIQKEYEKIAELLDELKEKKRKDTGNILVKVLRSHQKIELLKIPLFIELTRDFNNEGKSVVIFVNFTNTLKTLAKFLNTRCLIYGEQTSEERDININDFQNNTEKIIVCNIKAGAVGISLHDLYGGHPRISLISPTFNSTDLIQAIGRIHRAGSKSKALQRIVYIANTVEEQIADKLEKKIKNLNNLNNGDLNLTNINFDKR
jgi:Mimiviridae putative ATP-dependent RNA helicase